MARAITRPDGTTFTPLGRHTFKNYFAAAFVKLNGRMPTKEELKQAMKARALGLKPSEAAGAITINSIFSKETR